MSNRKNLKILKHKYPNVFGSTVAPLSKGVHERLTQQTDLTPTEIRSVLGYWTNTATYLQAIINSSHRSHLDGTQAEEVLDNEKKYATHKLNKMNARIKNKEAGWEFRESVLRKDFPDIFGKTRVPLVKDISAKLISAYPNTCSKIIREFITDWKKTKTYHVSVLQNLYIHDLSGPTKERVSIEMRQNALKWINIFKIRNNQRHENEK